MCLLAGGSPMILVRDGMELHVIGTQGLHHCEYSFFFFINNTMSGDDPMMLVAVKHPEFVLSHSIECRRNLFGMNLEGTLSDDIGNLTELTVL
jgi:hypothetical protein